ncbi:hypothetical protein Daesc_003556 [Daldinia eschscholtzii]|uniref:Uncharacterized protein n=1 Tax=Daldinia eschscholtzii TaxID=292717 RepID=A0AAX6MTG1_9PEZI
MDLSPLGALTSSTVAFIYLVVIVYVSVCIALGFKIARERCRNVSPIMGLSSDSVYVIAGIGLSILVLALLVPTLIGVGVACIAQMQRDREAGLSFWASCFRRRRNNNNNNNNDANGGGDNNGILNNNNNDNGSFVSNDARTAISTIISGSSTASSITPPPHYSQHRRDAWVSPAAMDAATAITAFSANTSNGSNASNASNVDSDATLRPPPPAYCRVELRPENVPGANDDWVSRP